MVESAQANSGGKNPRSIARCAELWPYLGSRMQQNTGGKNSKRRKALCQSLRNASLQNRYLGFVLVFISKYPTKLDLCNIKPYEERGKLACQYFNVRICSRIEICIAES